MTLLGTEMQGETVFLHWMQAALFILIWPGCHGALAPRRRHTGSCTPPPGIPPPAFCHIGKHSSAHIIHVRTVPVLSGTCRAALRACAVPHLLYLYCKVWGCSPKGQTASKRVSPYICRGLGATP